MNGAFKWIVGGLSGLILTGASWNESKQYETDKDHDKRLTQIEIATSAIKDNNEKLDNLNKKLDCIIDKRLCNR